MDVVEQVRRLCLSPEQREQVERFIGNYMQLREVIDIDPALELFRGQLTVIINRIHDPGFDQDLCRINRFNELVFHVSKIGGM